MDESTIRRLNAINRRFYERTVVAFDATRQQPWAGWNALRPCLKAGMRVLDVGCGNGRFGTFLARQLGEAGFTYTGIDSSAALLERARQMLAGVDARLELRDLVEQPLAEHAASFDLVALFGVLHHMPGAARRLELMRQLAGVVAPGGLLVFTEWRFMDVPHLSQRVIAWGDDFEVEPGDYLLDWRRGETALRYCHAVDAAEHARLVAATGMPLVSEYPADAANWYTLLKKMA